MSFHVPEKSRITDNSTLATDSSFGNNGAFKIASPESGWILFLIASDEGGWEHISIHSWSGAKTRTPNWKEMCFVKDLCWDEEDTVIQYHPPKSQYVNNHPNTLHLWRPIGKEIPIPERWMV